MVVIKPYLITINLKCPRTLEIDTENAKMLNCELSIKFTL
jgi:hypothetical protein